MTILKNLVVKNGSYEKNGETKHRWLTIGQLHEGGNGQYITLEAHVNLAAIPRKDADTRVMVSLFDPREDSGRPQRAAPAQAEDFDSDVPF
jgi:hypothetical protein